MSSKMFSLGSSNLRSINHSNRSNQRSSSWSSNWSNFRGNWNICSSNSESIDIISNVVDCLEDSISINILVTSSGHSKSILGFSLGRVDVLISKTELSKLILSMELTRRGFHYWSYWNWSSKGYGSWNWSSKGQWSWNNVS